MKKYITEYIQNTVLFFIITIIWNLLEGTPLNWIFMAGQSLLFGVVLTLITVWYSRRKKRKESELSNTNGDH